MGMDIKNTSLVTAIFDIGRDKWDSFGMSYHTYLRWMRNILYLDTNIVIYTEDKFVEDIINYRKEVDPNLQKTIMVVQPLEEIEGYKKFFNPLNDLMGSEEFKSIIGFNVPEMTKPLYNVVMFAKLFYIKDASEKNYFNSDLFVWTDAGVIRETNPIKNIQWPDFEKINKLDSSKVTFFCHHSQVRIDKKKYKSHALSQMRFIQGGSFFVPKTCVNEICELFEKTVFDCINKGYVGSDEKIFDFVYLTNPDNFNLIQCGWREYIDLYTSDEQLLKLKPQLLEVLKTYDVICEWEESEVEKCDDYSFWFFGIEDIRGKLIVRDDIIDQDMLNFSVTKKIIKVNSSTKPKKFVLWPSSKTKGYLTALKKDVKFVPNILAHNNKIIIDDYFFVNLDRRKDRLEFIKKQINKSEILTKSIKKWTAIDGREVNPNWIPSSIITKSAYNDITSGLPNTRGLSLTPGGLGFYLTHTKLWEYSVEYNKTIFVMDDDINVNLILILS